MLSERTRTIVIYLICVVWAANFLAGLTSFKGFESSESINGIFMAIVGGLFAYGARFERKKDDDEGGG